MHTDNTEGRVDQAAQPRGVGDNWYADYHVIAEYTPPISGSESYRLLDEWDTIGPS